MHYRLAQSFSRCALWCICAVALLGVTVLAQTPTPQNEKPRLRIFGSSLGQDDNNQPKPVDNKPENSGNSADEEDEVVRVDTTLVVADVLVLDRQGHSVQGLKQEDFIITEDNAQQQVGTFSLGSDASVPRSIVLIIDYSGSQLPYIENSVRAAQLLVDKLNPRDRMAIVTDDVTLLTDFTADKKLLKEKLELLKSYAVAGKLGHSRQYSSLLATLRELFDEEDLRPIIIFQTDGDEFYRLRQSPAYPQPPVIAGMNQPRRSFGYEDILAAVESSRATIYTVIPGLRMIGISPEEQRKRAEVIAFDRYAAWARLRNLTPQQQAGGAPKEFLKMFSEALYREQLSIAGVAKMSGGWWEFLEQPQQADEIYTRILTSINLRYVVGYYPTDQTRDDRRRKVNIEVRGHPEYTVWGRKIYTLRERKK